MSSDRFYPYLGGKLVRLLIVDAYHRKLTKRRGFVKPGDERFEFGATYRHLFGNWYWRNE